MTNKILKFSAEWCGPCRAMAPIVKGLTQEYEGQIVVEEINVDLQPDLATEFGVTSIPTLIYLKDDVVVKTFKGPQPKTTLKNAIQEVFGI